MHIEAVNHPFNRTILELKFFGVGRHDRPEDGEVFRRPTEAN
jgi:hypothetical protein